MRSRLPIPDAASPPSPGSHPAAAVADRDAPLPEARANPSRSVVSRAMAAPPGARIAVPVGATPVSAMTMANAAPAQAAAAGSVALPLDRTRADRRNGADGRLNADFRIAPDDRLGDAVLRLLDVVGALCALVIAGPVMLLVALAVWMTSPGPVLFAHRRIGRGGVAFRCLKFRTMTVDADAQLRALLDSDAAARAEWQRTQKLRRDPRVSPIGRFLRRTSLDELPQLFNVLAGSMSLVGPRPIVAAEIARYGRHFAVYCQVRPGLTGLWQVRRDGSTSYRRRVAFDVAFARARSPRLYLLIIARTVPAVLTGRGAW